MQKSPKFVVLILVNLIAAHTNYSLGQSNYIAYSNYINKAELFITENKFSDALVYYDSARFVKSIPFARDAYNAAVCAASIKNDDKCYFYLKVLIDKGVSLKHMQSVDLLNYFLKTKKGKQLIDYTKHNDARYNKRLRSIIDSLEAADQFFRSKEGKYVVYIDTIKKIDASNAFFLVKFIEKYGFPSEEMIGIKDDSLSLQLPYYAIVMHQQNGSPSSVMNFSEILTKALKNSEIEPHIATELIDRSDGTDKYGTEAYGLTKYVLDSATSVKTQYSNPVQVYNSIKWGYVNINPDYISKINKERNAIGLGTIEEGRKKGIYQQLKDNRFKLTTFSVYVFSEKAQFDEYSKQLIFVEQ